MTDERRRPKGPESGNWIPEGVDIESPNAARMYDYFLGGAHNFTADRELAEKVMALVPAQQFAQMNRAFLGRVVNFLVREAGIRQFLDLGSGVPTVGNVHEVAQSASADCRVVYVDNEPVAVEHGRLMLDSQPTAVAIEADLRNPQAVLTHPGVLQLIDFGDPVAVLMCAVLHFVPDSDKPARIVAEYRDYLARGSYLAISHATADEYPDELAKAVDLYESTSTPATLRTHDEISQLFDSFTMMPPGLVFTPLWRPDGNDNGMDPRQSLCYGGLAVL